MEFESLPKEITGAIPKDLFSKIHGEPLYMFKAISGKHMLAMVICTKGTIQYSTLDKLDDAEYRIEAPPLQIAMNRQLANFIKKEKEGN